MNEVIEATVRHHGSIGKGSYGHVVSKKLAPYIEQDVRITVKRILCPECHAPLRQGVCPAHGKVRTKEAKA